MQVMMVMMIDFGTCLVEEEENEKEISFFSLLACFSNSWKSICARLLLKDKLKQSPLEFPIQY